MTNDLLPDLLSEGLVSAEVNGALGLITLSRPEALNALTLTMVRDLTLLLTHWAEHPTVQAVVVLGQGREGKSSAFCAGGDIRFFHQAALANDPELQAFFTEEYALNHLIHRYAKPCIALMDGIVMGGGMGIAQGAKLRVVNERSALAMPETRIGLFPDVGGSWFLGQLPGHVGEWLALTGQVLGAGDSLELGLADVFVPSRDWDGMVHDLRTAPQPNAEHVVATVMERVELAPDPQHLQQRRAIDRHFAGADLPGIVASLSAEGDDAWCRHTLQQLACNSPLMMAVSLRLVRQGRCLDLADALRLERNLVWHCFAPAAEGQHSEAVEGIRALVLDKDRSPAWQPNRLEDVSPQAVAAFFESPWAGVPHPLATLT